MKVWHQLRGHRQWLVKRHGHSLWDLPPHGLYLQCSCGKRWAL